MPRTLAYDLHGADDAPVLVLSGGLGTERAMWDAQLPAFSKRNRVLGTTRPARRLAAPGRPLAVADIGASVLELLDELAVRQASFCGLSLGGMVGMWLAAEAPSASIA